MSGKKLVLLSGTYTNKGGLAIVYGTLKLLNDLGIKTKYIVDPDPSFPEEFYTIFNLKPIFRWSDKFGDGETKSLTLSSSIKLFMRLLKNSRNPKIKQMENCPIWYIGDSSLNDYGSVMALFGQIINLWSLKRVTGGKLIVNASMGYMRTKKGEIIFRSFLNSIDYFLVRGSASYANVSQRGVADNRISTVCDMAFFLERSSTSHSDGIIRKIPKSNKPTVALIFKDYSNSDHRGDYIAKIHELNGELEKQFNVLFVPTAYVPYKRENDAIFLKEIGINRVLDISSLNPGEIIDVFSHFDVVITSRLHGAVYSALAGTPTYHIYEAPNSIDVIQDTFGATIPLIHIYEFIKIKPEDVIAKIKTMIDKKQQIGSDMREKIDNNKSKTREKVRSVLEQYCS